MKQGYEIAPGGLWIRCLACGCKSFNPNDVKMRYCANCHAWLDTCCDFCSGRLGFAHDYIAASHIHGVLSDGRIVVDRDGLWAACPICMLLIEAAAWESMIRRVHEAHGWTEATMRPRVIFMYQSVFGNRFTVNK